MNRQRNYFSDKRTGQTHGEQEHISTAELPCVPSSSELSNASAFDTLQMDTRNQALDEIAVKEIAIKDEVLAAAKSLRELLSEFSRMEKFDTDHSIPVYCSTIGSLIDAIGHGLHVEPLLERLRQPIVPMTKNIILQYGSASNKKAELESILRRFEKCIENFAIFALRQKEKQKINEKV
jgi:hypothetical protein